MKIEFENKDMPHKENMFIVDDVVGVYGWYGLNYFEISVEDGWYDRERLYRLKGCIDTMIREIERLEGD